MTAVLMPNESINTAIGITKKTELHLCPLVFKTITTNPNKQVRPNRNGANIWQAQVD